MSSSISKKQIASTVKPVMPRRAMQGHTAWVQGVVHLPGGRRIITCLDDGSLRLWDLESGKQIGEDWRDEGDKAGAKNIALSPNGNVIAAGSDDGTVILWDVETGKVIAKWAGHTENVLSVCWSADGERVLSGSSDGTVRVWDVMNGETILAIETGHAHVWAGIYSPDQTKFATGGTLKHSRIVFSLAWTSDGKKLISSSYGPITIFDTATWQEIAILQGHTNAVWAISLSRNNRLLASASDDNTARLWNLDTNLPVGPPLHHEHEVTCAAFSADFGKVLVTGCEDKNVYVWDIHAILEEPGLEYFLPDITATTRKSLKSDATRQAFFDSVKHDAKSRSFATHGINPHSPLQRPRRTRSSVLARILSLFRHSHYNTNDGTQLNVPIVDIPIAEGKVRNVSAKTQQQHQSHGQGPSTIPIVPIANTTTPPVYSRPHRLLARVVLFLCCVSPQHTDDHAQPTQQQEGQSQGQAQGSSPQTQPAASSTSATPTSGSRPDGLISRLFSLFRSQRHTNEDTPHVVEVAAMEDKGSLHVSASGRPEPDLSHPQSTSTARPGARSLPVRLLGHVGLFLCCICNHQKADSNPQETQQQEGQPQDQVQTHATSSQTQQQARTQGQASSSQTQPAASLTSATPASSSRPDALISRMSLLFRPQTHTDEEIELSEFPSRPHAAGVAAVQEI